MTTTATADILAARAAGDVVRDALRAALGTDLVDISIRTVPPVEACAGRVEGLVQVTAVVRGEGGQPHRDGRVWGAICAAAQGDLHGGDDAIPWAIRVAPPGTSGPGVLTLVALAVESEGSVVSAAPPFSEVFGRLLTSLGDPMAGRDCTVSAILSAGADKAWARLLLAGPDGDTTAVLDALPDTDWGPATRYVTADGARAIRRTSHHADVQIAAVSTEGAR